MKTGHHAALMVAAVILHLLPFVRSEIRAGIFEMSPFAGYNFTKHFGIEAAGEF
ncbi:MAG: hypothetical protein R6U29_13295 [Desulfosudaceae bacterium]